MYKTERIIAQGHKCEFYILPTIGYIQNTPILKPYKRGVVFTWLHHSFLVKIGAKE